MPEKFGLERGMRRLADDELMHWKYIKRVKKSDGTYRYYYDYSKNVFRNNLNARKQANDMRNAVEAIERKRLNANDNYEAHKTRNYIKADRLLETRNRYDEIYWRGHPKAYSADVFIDENAPKLVKQLNKVSDTISKAKRWLNNLFKKKT